MRGDLAAESDGVERANVSGDVLELLDVEGEAVRREVEGLGLKFGEREWGRDGASAVARIGDATVRAMARMAKVTPRVGAVAFGGVEKHAADFASRESVHYMNSTQLKQYERSV